MERRRLFLCANKFDRFARVGNQLAAFQDEDKVEDEVDYGMYFEAVRGTARSLLRLTPIPGRENEQCKVSLISSLSEASSRSGGLGEGGDAFTHKHCGDTH